MLKEIEGQISQIREQLLREAATSHPLLNAQWLEIESDLILARLLLLSAKLNKYCFSRLKPAAVALELLDLAVKRHYKSDGRWQMADGRWQRSESRGQKSEVRSPTSNPQPPTSNPQPPTSNPHLSLIAGDYYYAKALAIVAALKDSLVIEILSRAIGNVAEEKANGADDEQLKKRASLYVAACQLGAYLSESDSDTIEVLKVYGENFGIAHQMIISGGEKERAKHFFKAAKQALLFLPESPPRFYLADLLPFLRSGDL